MSSLYAQNYYAHPTCFLNVLFQLLSRHHRRQRGTFTATFARFPTLISFSTSVSRDFVVGCVLFSSPTVAVAVKWLSPQPCWRFVFSKRHDPLMIQRFGNISERRSSHYYYHHYSRLHPHRRRASRATISSLDSCANVSPTRHFAVVAAVATLRPFLRTLSTLRRLKFSTPTLSFQHLLARHVANTDAFGATGGNAINRNFPTGLFSPTFK